MLEFEAHVQRQCIADDAGYDSEDEIESANVLVICAEQPPIDETRMVIVMRDVRVELADVTVLNKLAHRAASEADARCCRVGAPSANLVLAATTHAAKSLSLNASTEIGIALWFVPQI